MTVYPAETVGSLHACGLEAFKPKTRSSLQSSARGNYSALHVGGGTPLSRRVERLVVPALLLKLVEGLDVRGTRG